MKNFTFLASITFLFFLSLETFAQKQLSPISIANTLHAAAIRRCGTAEAFQENINRDAQFRAQYEKGLLDYERSLQNIQSIQQGRTLNTARTSTLPDSVVIPVVVHIVLPNPNVVTDADVQFFLRRLNDDYSGRNADSTNGSLFYSVRGHSKIRFVLAKRTPSGTLTNGIERRAANLTIALTTYQAVKHASAGGLDPWPVADYYNLWVGDPGGSGLLGISPSIGPGLQTETTTSTIGIDGVCVSYQGFAANTCYTIGAFALARTAVHEIGHNFGLFHITGDASCGVDFKQILGSCQLPDSLLAPSDDTPTQTALTSGCPAGAAASGCAASPNPPGKMYQNYMDYTDDPCYSMFTKGQVKRMEYVLEFCRAGYLTTQGGLPPASAIALDAGAFEAVNPGGYELVGCVVTNYPAAFTCPGPITPKFRFQNNGTTTITSITGGYTLNGGASVEVTVTGISIPTGGTYVITFPSDNLIDGTNTFKFYTKNPNGGTDQNIANDTLTRIVTISTSPLPVTEGFEGATFPPAPWSVVKVSGTSPSWTKRTPGRNSTNSIFVNYYSNGTGNVDDFRSGRFTTAPGEAVAVSFDLAYKFYGSGTTTTAPDTLAVLVSSDCGATFTEVYKKWGTNLATAGGGTAQYTPAAADWKTESIVIPAALLTSGKFQVIFRGKSRFGNNIFIDNINISKKYNRDIRPLTVLQPSGSICSGTIAPQVQITNNGLDTIKSFQINYSASNGGAGSVVINTPLAPGATVIDTLPNVTVGNGTGTFTVTITNVVFTSGLAEEDVTNNTVTSTYTRVVLNSSITEGFEATPVGWTVSNPNGNNTWVITSPGHNSLRSAFINNYDFNVPGNIDDLRSPFLNTAGADSVIISFDLAHKNYPGATDQLQVLAVTGCGTVFTPTSYSKGGTVLATAGPSTASYLAPVATDWKTERLSIGASILGTSGNALIAWRNTNGFGNNIFIDNVNITTLYKRDLQVTAINSPGTISCSGSITPSVTVMNNGTEVITGYKVSYTIDNGAPQTATVVTGVSIPRNSTATIALTASTIAVGTHTIKVFSFEPITASGTGDQNTTNDTLTKTFNILATVSAPLVETFTSTTFPPTNWTVINSDGGITWRRYATGNGNPGSAYINSYNYPGLGQQDDLLSPFVSYSSVDSVRLSFDLSAVTYVYPGSTEIPIDTLEVLVSKDCGNTYKSVYKKWGIDLQTINAPNDPQAGEFFPTSPSHWRRDSVDLTGYAPNSPIGVIFRVTNNYENNIFLDNISLTTRTLPTQLKQQGYLILPTPFTNSFNVWHYTAPSTLKSINVFNSSGQMVWSKQFTGNASNLIQVDLTGKAAGLYVVELGYTDTYRNVSQKILKY